jgi:hypothetical protein
MTKWEEEPYDPEEEERDDPQLRDLEELDGDETPTVACPHCGQEIYDDADRCVHCGQWVVKRLGGPGPGRRGAWWLLGLIGAGLALLLWLLI